jgi:hypothetical protein
MTDEEQSQEEMVRADLAKAEEDISGLTQRVSSLQTSLSEIDSFYSKFTELKENLDDDENGVEANLDWVKESKEEIDAMKVEADQQLSSIKTNLEEANTKLGEISVAHEAFLGVKSEADDEEDGIKANLDSSKNKRAEIETLKTEADGKLATIRTHLTDVEVKVSEMEGVYTRFEASRDKIEDEESGLEATLVFVVDIKKKISGTKTSADNTFQEIKSFHGQIKKLHEESVQDRDSISKLKDESESLKDSIGETLELVTDSSLNNAFIERKQELKKEVAIWMGVLIGGLVLLAGSVLFIYYLQSKDPAGFDVVQQLARYFFTSPILFLIYEAAKNYSSARGLLEKYAFKAVMSTTLSSYIKLLDHKFPENKDEVRAFTVDHMNCIYKEPYVEKNKKRRLIFALKYFGDLEFVDEEEKLLYQARNRSQRALNDKVDSAKVDEKVEA